MKKKIVKILTIAFCMVSIFTVSAAAYNVDQPDPDYLPFIMQDTGTIIWQMLPFDSFAIAKDTFPEGQSLNDIGNIIVGEMNTYYALWATVPATGSYDGIVQFYGEYYTSDEPTGFQIRVYDYTIEEEYIYINLGIYEPATSNWVYDPQDYVTEDNYTNAKDIPVVLFSNDMTVAGSSTFNRELGYWVLAHYPIANTLWEEQDNPLYNIGYRDGKANAEKAVFNEGKVAGYNEAAIIEYNRGFNAGLQQGDETTFASLIFAVIDTPINVLTSMLDFNILGTNMTSFVQQMISALLFLVVVKVIVKVLV